MTRRRLGSAAAAASLALALALLGGAAAAPAGDVAVGPLAGPQTNATVTVDPHDSSVLLAGSNSLLEAAERYYSSTDGGLTWSTSTVTPAGADVHASCPSDPGVAIDLQGNQYFSFDRVAPCTPDGPSRIYVARRSGPTQAWSTPVLVAPLGTARVDDKPAIVVDGSPVSPHRNRVYVAWSRVSRRVVASIVLSHSDDGGRTWSRPVQVNRGGDDLNYASVATARDGTVYVAWTDSSRYSVLVSRSTDGGAHFGPETTAAAFSLVPIPHCGIGIVVRADPRTCIQADPTVTVDTSGGRYSGRVYVSYTGTVYTGDQGAALSTFDSRLRPLAGYPATHEQRIVVPPPARSADQFWAQSAIDRVTGALWLCFYQTAGTARVDTYYSCTASVDGGARWARVVRAARAPSNETQPGAREYGYYQGVAVADGVAHPIWTDTRDLARLGEEIYTARLSRADLAR